MEWIGGGRYPHGLAAKATAVGWRSWRARPSICFWLRRAGWRGRRARRPCWTPQADCGPSRGTRPPFCRPWTTCLLAGRSSGPRDTDGRLYLLDRGGRIHRYGPRERSDTTGGGVSELLFAGSTRGLAPGGEWICRAAIDIAIDGRILVLLRRTATIRALSRWRRTHGLRRRRNAGAHECLRAISTASPSSGPDAGGRLRRRRGAGTRRGWRAFRARLRLKTQPRSSDDAIALPRAACPSLHAVWWDEAAGAAMARLGECALPSRVRWGPPPLQP